MCWLLHPANISYGILCGVPGFLTNPLEMNTWKIIDHFCFCRNFLCCLFFLGCESKGPRGPWRIVLQKDHRRAKQIPSSEAPNQMISMWGPRWRYVCWFISQSNYSSFLRTINHIVFINQLNAIKRGPHIDWIQPFFMEIQWKSMESKLVGGWALPLWNIWVRWDYYAQYLEKQTHVPNPKN